MTMLSLDEKFLVRDILLARIVAILGDNNLALDNLLDTEKIDFPKIVSDFQLDESGAVNLERYARRTFEGISLTASRFSDHPLSSECD